MLSQGKHIAPATVAEKNKLYLNTVNAQEFFEHAVFNHGAVRNQLIKNVCRAGFKPHGCKGFCAGIELRYRESIRLIAGKAVPRHMIRFDMTIVDLTAVVE